MCVRYTKPSTCTCYVYVFVSTHVRLLKIKTKLTSVYTQIEVTRELKNMIQFGEIVVVKFLPVLA